MKRTLLMFAGVLSLALLAERNAAAQYPYSEPYVTAPQQAVNVSYGLPWHNAYYHQAYGEPYSLVVPPTAEYQTHYGWGVGGMRNTPIFHQYSKAYPGSQGFGGYRFRHPPYWPSDTNEFGVYYNRGPW